MLYNDTWCLGADVEIFKQKNVYLLKRLNGLSVHIPSKFGFWLKSNPYFLQSEIDFQVEQEVFEFLVYNGYIIPNSLETFCRMGFEILKKDNLTTFVGVPSGSLLCRQSPDSIRRFCPILSFADGISRDLSRNIFLHHPLDIQDLGNFANESWLTSLTRLGPKEQRIIALGGDHMITWYALAGLARKGDKIEVLHFDAHTDCAIAEDRQYDCLNHASFMRFAKEKLNIEKVYQYGMRSLEHVKSHQKFGDMNSTFVRLNQFENTTKTKEYLSKVLFDTDVLAVTIDIDVLDPSIAPGVSHPEAGGLSYNKLVSILRIIEEIAPPKYLDIVEVGDQKKTAKIAGALLSDIIFTRYGVTHAD